MTAVIDNPAEISVTDHTDLAEKPRTNGHQAEAVSDETAVELGIWLSGIESFIGMRHSFAGRGTSGPSADASKEFRLTNAALARCASLCARLSASGLPVRSNVSVPGLGVSTDEFNDLVSILRDLLQIGRCYSRAEPLATGEWNAWRNLLDEKINNLPAIGSFIQYAEECGELYMPEPLRSFSRSSAEMTPEKAELALVLPRFAKVLRWLNVVGKMLETDEPLKPALLVFARVNEQAQDLITYLNNRLERFPDNSTEMFASLDGAAYLASIEMKKVFTHELTGLIQIKPAPTVYSGMETAYSILNESFQHILAGMAKFVDPSVDGVLLFPSFRANFERSFALRQELWDLVQLTQAAEVEPEKKKIQALNRSLRAFMSGPVKFLFYKDTETFERFVEEIMVGKEERDLVPILHRFGAYLETLFGQVGMRAVLEKHPFVQPKS